MWFVRHSRGSRAVSFSAGVYFVGVGPGDPELMTVRAQKLIAAADVLLYTDSLVPPAILADARPDAERLPTAHRTLEEILPILKERVAAGAIVARLHDGDPSLYSTIAEQIAGLRSQGIPYQVIPGVSAFQAAAARLGQELTLPGLVQTIILTRCAGRIGLPDRESLSSLAAHQASLCLYLSARQAEKAQSELLEHYPPETPIAVCYRLGWPDEAIWLGKLSELAQITQDQQLDRTVLYLVSPALDVADAGRSQLYNPDYHHLFRPEATAARSPQPS
ncbi:precorrin-4 C(11)-methyltransferase [Synechococcus elongatus]|uniref:Precorrin-4 C(11)-methyltransferase n=1 Tax=Synechococcus elongatus PCC 11801 TaxID=2219813 RepID=A0AAN1QPD2_SYNEL|nr:precorrin-4 C(11)-methyltransferase [Synechococcus elongatus]AZB73077.1 precorrin-4 C(11)-methyltransferase [Synechococcus elongatus PCC 11801]